jgi:hypothetical protein
MCGVLGALIILVSWLVANTVKKRVESLEARLELIVRDKDQNDHFSEIGDLLSSMHQDLIALSTSFQSVQHQSHGSRGFTPPLELHEEWVRQEAQWDQLFMNDLRSTQKSAARLRDFLSRVPMPDSLAAHINATAGAMDSLEALIATMSESAFDAETTLVGAGGHFMDDLTDDQREGLLRIEQTVHDRLRNDIGPAYVRETHRLTNNYEAVVTFATQELHRRRHEARIVGVLELFLYGLGSLTIIVGKLIELRIPRGNPN